MTAKTPKKKLPSIKIDGRRYFIGDSVISNGICGVWRGAGGTIHKIRPKSKLPIGVVFVKEPDIVWVKPEHLINHQPSSIS